MSNIVFFKKKTAYEMRIIDWSSDVFSSDLHDADPQCDRGAFAAHPAEQRAEGRNRRRQHRALGRGRKRQGDSVDRLRQAEAEEAEADKRQHRSEESRVEQERGSRCRSWWKPDYKTKRHNKQNNTLKT